MDQNRLMGTRFSKLFFGKCSNSFRYLGQNKSYWSQNKTKAVFGELKRQLFVVLSPENYSPHRLFHKQLNLENILVLEENCRSTVVFCSNGKWVSRKHSTTRQKTFGELVFELFVRAVEVGSSSERLSV